MGGGGGSLFLSPVPVYFQSITMKVFFVCQGGGRSIRAAKLRHKGRVTCKVDFFIFKSVDIIKACI